MPEKLIFQASPNLKKSSIKQPHYLISSGFLEDLNTSSNSDGCNSQSKSQPLPERESHGLLLLDRFRSFDLSSVDRDLAGFLQLNLQFLQMGSIDQVSHWESPQVDRGIHLSVFTIEIELGVKGGIVAQTVKLVNELPATLMRVVAFAFGMILHNIVR